MPMVEDISMETWEPAVTLTQNEAWSCDEGTVRVSADANPGEHDGRKLQKGEAWPFPSGAAVRCRALSEGARISREPIA